MCRRGNYGKLSHGGALFADTGGKGGAIHKQMSSQPSLS